MVANRPTTDPLVTLLDSLQRRVDEASRATRFPIMDQLGNVLYDLDTDAGYGLAKPSTPIAMNNIAGIIYNSSSSATTVVTGAYTPINPGLVMRAYIDTTSNSPSAVVALQWNVAELSTGYSWTSDSEQYTGVTSTTTTPRGVVLPETLMGLTVTVNIQSWVVTQVSGTDGVAVTPNIVLGCSQAMANAPHL